MLMVDPTRFNVQEEVTLEIGRWEVVVDILAVEYESCRDMVLQPASKQPDDIMYNVERLKTTRNTIEAIQRAVNHVWFPETDKIWLENWR